MRSAPCAASSTASLPRASGVRRFGLVPPGGEVHSASSAVPAPGGGSPIVSAGLCRRWRLMLNPNLEDNYLARRPLEGHVRLSPPLGRRILLAGPFFASKGWYGAVFSGAMQSTRLNYRNIFCSQLGLTTEICGFSVEKSRFSGFAASPLILDNHTRFSGDIVALDFRKGLDPPHLYLTWLCLCPLRKLAKRGAPRVFRAGRSRVKVVRHLIPGVRELGVVGFNARHQSEPRCSESTRSAGV